MTNELTDDELDNILLSNDHSVRQIKDPSQKKESLDLSHLTGKKKKKKTKKRKYTKKKDSKNPGRPLIWTKEKIAAEKAKKKIVHLAKRKLKKENETQNKILLNRPFSKAEQKRSVAEIVEHRDQIKKDLLDERNEEISLRDNTNFTPVCNHIDRFTHIDTAGHFVSSCIYCSRSKIWEPVDWDRYWTKTKKIIKELI